MICDQQLHALRDDPGWLAQRLHNVFYPVQFYWAYHNVLTFEEGIILHEVAIIVPPVEQENALHTMLKGHQSMTMYQLQTQNWFTNKI